jgi:hypothetical protein
VIETEAFLRFTETVREIGCDGNSGLGVGVPTIGDGVGSGVGVGLGAFTTAPGMY